jgi:succinyl-diaminopimelate desuccinylase
LRQHVTHTVYGNISVSFEEEPAVSVNIEDQALVASIDAYVETVWPEVLADIAELVAVPSVADAEQAAPGAPHGPQARRALDVALEQCARLGLEPHNLDGWMGYADLKGASDTQIATIAHVDVVPAGTGWTFEPFALSVRDGYLIGRGVIDDKGPAVLTMYMAHYFARQEAPLPYTLRVMLGSDEEVGMTDIEHYQSLFDDPAFLFTPDADFPVCCGEKGRVEGLFAAGPFDDGKIVTFEGGTVANAVPSIATVTVRADAAALPAAENVDVEDLGDDTVRLTAHGIGGHASLPEGTRNAIGMLVDYLLANGTYAAAEKPWLDLLARVFASTDGSSVGIDATDDLFDPLTCIGGTIRMVDGHFEQSVDIRYPKSTDGEHIAEVLGELARGFGADFAAVSDMPPFYIDPANPAVTALVDAYNTFTGKDAHPFTIGGGTYARHFKNAVSFGPEEPDAVVPAWVGPMHGADEGVSEEQMKRSLKIYIYALSKLMELEL